MLKRLEVKSASTDDLRARLSSKTIGTYERELVIREIQNRKQPGPPRKPGKLTQGLLDDQLEYIDSL